MSAKAKRIIGIIIVLQLFGFVSSGFSVDLIGETIRMFVIVIAIGGISYIIRNYKGGAKVYQEGKECPNCKATIGTDEERCPYCGYNYSPTIECDYCSTINNTSNSRCSNCNAMLH